MYGYNIEIIRCLPCCEKFPKLVLVYKVKHIDFLETLVIPKSRKTYTTTGKLRLLYQNSLSYDLPVFEK